MSSCAVVTSVIAPYALSSHLNEAYPQFHSCNCRLLKTGINHTYLVAQDSKTYVFRIYCFGWRSESEIKAELDWLLVLHENMLPISIPIADKKGNYIQSIDAPEGRRFGVLFTVAHGQKLQQLTIYAHAQIGSVLAKMHQIGNDKKLNRPTYSPESMMNQGLQAISNFLSPSQPEMQYLMNLKEHLSRKLREKAFQNLDSGIVHMDLWFDNINVNDDEEVTIFDFDFCGNGYLALDIAYYQLQLFNTEVVPEKRNEKQQAFLQAYQLIQPFPELNPSQWATLSLCMYYFYLGIQCSRFQDWSASFLNETYLKRYIENFIKKFQVNHFKME